MIGKEGEASREEIVTAYEQYYAEPGRLRESDAFYRWVLRKMEPVSGSRLLDVACGEGHLGRLASDLGLIVTSIDFSPLAVKLAGEAAGEGSVAVADGQRLPFCSQNFDYIMNLGSLEHFTSLKRGLLEMRRLLKPDGKVALVLPNSYYLLDIIWHVWRRGYPVSHSQVIERFATAGEWVDLIQAHGFIVNEAYKYNMCWPCSFSDLKWYLQFPKKIPYFLLGPFTPFNLSYSFLFICGLS